MTFTAHKFNTIVPNPYMDEIFHIPQAQRYCKGDYWTWDPKLTTPPGLYAISNLMLLLKRPVCTTLALRLTNFIYPIVSFFAMAGILKHLHGPRVTRSQCYITSAIVLLFPMTWFFNFLYYTDGGSTTFFLVSWLAALKRSHVLAALGLAIALTFRQTNIIWALFILGTSLLNIATPEERRRFDRLATLVTSPLDVVSAVFGFLQVLLKHLGSTIVTSAPYLGLLAAFGAFVRWNGGIVLGDRSNHVPHFHLVQLLYFVAFSAGMSFFVLMGVLPIKRILRPPSRLRFVHPFLLADNRHYTFYITRILLLRSWVTRYIAVPFYMLAAWLMWQALAVKQTVLWCIIYIVATTLTLVPTPLVEFRYFIVPYLVYRLSMDQPRTWWPLLLEAGLYGFCNLVTVYLFLYRPFRWVHADGVQRFMW
ncbi:glucosyltransferase [Actinomortierella ambigua]|uniref:Dol-P-Glc:Glc(2)Man(9)GlcNAc(2)-PP-Dol alpha-1,2-glucosyltransferase n=1 Tax=Actinomortierella ambigua TaxID=1343610 RepID=A0A9P6PXS5_9FUNG|nr:glucosyltransferase [Actinomortierella ambigua]